VRGSSGWRAPEHLELSEQDLDDSPGRVYTGREFRRLAKFSKRDKPRAASVARVFGKGSSGGALLAVRSSEDRFEEHELIFLHACASLLGAALERNYAEDQLRQSHKMEAVGQLAGGVAHDFNNLLTGILTCNELAIEELGPAHPSLPLLEDVSRAGEHAALLTRQLLAFSRKETLRLEVVDLGRVVLDLGRILQRLVGERVELDIDCVTGDAYVYADRNALEQIVLNLCLNARDAVNSQGHITVGVARRTRDRYPGAPHTPTRERVILSVKDDGCGMANDTQRRIFEPFFTTKGPGKGTGLGLATVQGIVEELGGQTDVESTLDEGSCFYVTLPSVTATQKSSIAPGAPPPRSRSREVCLLVEDHPLARRALEGTLKSAGYAVTTATNGREALALLEARERIDIVLSDIVMPEMTGIEMAIELRRRGSTLPIVLLTGYAGVSQTDSELAVLDVPILTKPVPAAQLLALVREEIDKHAA
jgi:signal transduction histidine kinase/CheY-like chemotaxis protein